MSAVDSNRGGAELETGGGVVGIIAIYDKERHGGV
jgi:hypothetical protein